MGPSSWLSSPSELELDKGAVTATQQDRHRGEARIGCHQVRREVAIEVAQRHGPGACAIGANLSI